MQWDGIGGLARSQGGLPVCQLCAAAHGWRGAWLAESDLQPATRLQRVIYGSAHVQGIAMNTANCTATPMMMPSSLVHHSPAQCCRLQQAFGAVAAALAPHLRLAQSERALQATRQLLHDAASLEQAQSTAWQRHQKRQAEAAAAGPQQPAAPATPRGDPALRAQSSTTVDSVDLAPPTATAAAANTLAAPPGPALEQQLAARLLTAPRTAARHAVQWLQAAVGVSFRPAPEQPRAPLQRISSARKPGKGKGEAVLCYFNHGVQSFS